MHVFQIFIGKYRLGSIYLTFDSHYVQRHCYPSKPKLKTISIVKVKLFIVNFLVSKYSCNTLIHIFC